MFLWGFIIAILRKAPSNAGLTLPTFSFLNMPFSHEEFFQNNNQNPKTKEKQLYSAPNPSSNNRKQ
jgi:hypothetical protein